MYRSGIYSPAIYRILSYLLQGTGVGEIRNPSDPASYGLDPKKATLKLRFRVQKNYAPIAATKNINKKFSNIEAEDENGNTMWEAVLWKGRPRWINCGRARQRDRANF